MFFWITFWLLQVFVQMWKHIEYYNIHHDYVDGFDDEEEEETDDDDDDLDTDLEDEDEDEDVKPLASEEAVKEEEEKEENKNDFLNEEEFVREFVQIIRRNIDDGEFAFDDSWLYQSLRREIN